MEKKQKKTQLFCATVCNLTCNGDPGCYIPCFDGCISAAVPGEVVDLGDSPNSGSGSGGEGEGGVIASK